MPHDAKSRPPKASPGNFHNAKAGALLSEQVKSPPRGSMEGILAERAGVVQERAAELEADARDR